MDTMPGPMSEIVILIDISSVQDEFWSDDVMEHIKEAVSFQISREAITKRKLIRLGFEPYLARVKWSYSFVDATSSANEQPSVIGTPLEPLTYDRWDLFEKDMNKAVKLFQSRKGPRNTTTINTRMTNLMEILELVKFPKGQQQPSPLLDNGQCQKHLLLRRLSEDELQDVGSHPDKFLFIFTSVPKVFSSLVHLARGLTVYRHSFSRNSQCSPKDIQICLVDLQFDPSTGPASNDNNYSFWEELSEGKDSSSASLKIACLKKIVMIHKLNELRHPWKYDSVSFGFGMGMKRLRQLEWRIPNDLPYYRELGIQCLPLRLRRCWSDEQ